MNRAKLNESGFTLIEMIVVVAIVGVLASIAIPTYERFQARARNTEAKIALGALYTGEQAYAAENLSYTACIANIGFAPDSPNRFFRVGFSSTQALGNFCGPNGNQACNQVNWPLGGGAGTPCQVESAMVATEPYAYPATLLMPGAPVLPTDAQMPQSAILSKTDFVASAVSNSPLISSNDAVMGVATAAIDLLESDALADGDGNSGNGNSGSGNQGGGGNGGQGGSGNNGGNSGGGSGSSTQPNTDCPNPSTVWTIDSSRKLVLGKVCN